ncbi:Forkhead-associated (FHA) domain containing protein [Klebsormidium nitens]|uniref:E3 ubiquitin-protein ligase CHFR n=1 Tax=Klebsormidium nitens TaxID=105231 RepID=A0A1Y1IKH9_KLENI|nr:Forkhead-associated (FHA) domain containing protein [Klebsormidium nitens]|eukprot:GAQ89187.1 Forkhead-associated (FHA) domain containing protein [Klebsormidium nitens]
MLRRLPSGGGADEEAISCPACVRLDEYQGPIRLGRHTSAEIRCLSTKTSAEREVTNAAVSRWHAEITRTAGGDYVIKDTSANGTMVNGHKLVGTHTLAEGDVIILGMPTYKATPHLETSTEVTNPFRFEFSVDQGRPVGLSEAQPAAPLVPPGVPQLDKQSHAAQPPGCSLLSPPAPLEKPLGASLRSAEERLPRVDLAGVNPTLDRIDRVQKPSEDTAQLQDGDASRPDSTANLVKPRHPADRNTGGESRRGRRLVRIHGDRQGNGNEFVDLSDLPEVELPDAGRGAGGARRQRLEDQTEAARTGDGIGHALNTEQAGQDRESGRQQADTAEGLGRVDEGRERVRQRLMEVVRAKARADERQSPLKRRSPDSPSTGVSRMAKLLKPGTASRTAAPGTPLSLADDCPLLEVPEVGDGRGGAVRTRGLGPQSAGSAPNPGQSLVIEVPASMDPPANQDADVPDGLIVDPPGEASAPSVPVEPPQAPPTATEDSAKQSAEAEVLEMLGEEMQCVICQSFLCAAHALPCSHTFCGDCLVQWLSKKPHCPTCRQPTGGANPTPIHNIDSMIERAASRCMSAEEKAEFDRRKGVFKTSKKLKPAPATAAPARARAARTTPGHLLHVFRSGTLQAVSARLEEAMSGMSDGRARDLMRNRPRLVTETARRGPPASGPAAPPNQPPGAPGAPATTRGTFGRPYIIDIPTTATTVCAVCNQAIGIGRFRLTDAYGDSGQTYHLGCLSARGMIQPYQIAGMEDLPPAAQARARTIVREPGGVFIRSPRSDDQAPQEVGEPGPAFPGVPRRL